MDSWHAGSNGRAYIVSLTGQFKWVGRESQPLQLPQFSLSRNWTNFAEFFWGSNFHDHGTLGPMGGLTSFPSRDNSSECEEKATHYNFPKFLSLSRHLHYSRSHKNKNWSYIIPTGCEGRINATVRFIPVGGDCLIVRLMFEQAFVFVVYFV